MAMLAEGKSKTKWVLNPRGSNAINEMHFGRKMLEKMGWQSGDGLGTNKQGVTEPLRVSYKNDVKGIGYKKNVDNEWLKVEDEFSKILQNLSSDSNTNVNAEATIESLEKKSEGSKARLHYRKFTRNKDLSRYSEKDLSCILGHAKNQETAAVEEDEDSKFRAKGTMDSYFAQLTRKFSPSSCETEENVPSSVERSKIEKTRKKKRKLEKSNLESDSNEVIETLDEINKSEVSKSTRKKLKNDHSFVESSDIQKTVDEISKSRKSKSKKLGMSGSNEVEKSSKMPMEIDEYRSLKSCNDSGENVEKKRKKKKGGSSLTSDAVENSLSLQEIDSSLPDTSTMLVGKKPENKLKGIKLDESNCVSDACAWVGANRRKKKKSREDTNETEVMMNVQNGTNSENFKRKGKMKRNKRKCNFMENGRSGSSAEESDNDVNTNARKHEIQGKLKGETLDGFVAEKNVCSLGDRKETQNKENDYRKSKRSLDSDENTEKLSKETEDFDLKKVKIEKGKKKKSKRDEDAKNEVGNEMNHFESYESSSSKKKMFTDDKELGENEEFSIKKVKLEDKNFNDENPKKKKKSKNDKVEILTKELEKIGNSDIKKVKLERDSSSESSLVSNISKTIDNVEQPSAETDIMNICKLESENNNFTDEVARKKKSKKHKKEAAKSIEGKCKNIGVENSELADSSSCDSEKKKKKSKLDEIQDAVKSTEVVVKSEIFEDENITKTRFSKDKSQKKKKVADSEELIAREEIKDTLEKSQIKKSEMPQNNDECTTTKKSKSKKRKAENSLKTSEVTSNIDESNLSSPSSKISDKKAKLLALLAKTTKDSDDSDSDSDSSAVVPSSCFKGSNFEQITGYRNLSRR